MLKSTFGLPPSRISDFAYALQRIMDLARSVSSLNCADRTGGHFVLMDGNTGNILLATLVGESPVDKAEIYWTNAHEKARRVRERMISNGHMFSRQSRSPEENQWGGSFVAWRTSREQELVGGESGAGQV